MLPEYNGYTNYPTWNIHLWITNDQGLYEQALDIVNQDYEFNFQRDDALKDWVYDILHGVDGDDAFVTGMAADLLGFAMAWTNWSEITDALREE